MSCIADGGSYAPDSISKYKTGIAELDQHMLRQLQLQLEDLAAIQKEAATELLSALSNVEQLLPSYEQDMTLVETLDRCVSWYMSYIVCFTQTCMC